MSTTLSSTFVNVNDERPFSWKDAFIALGLGFVVSTVVAVIGFIIVDAIGLIPDSATIERLGGERGHLVTGDAFGMMLSVWFVAAIIFLLLRKFAKKPLRTFVIVAAVGTVLSFLSPVLQIDDVPAKMVIGLNLLHVLAAVTGVGTMVSYLNSRR